MSFAIFLATGKIPLLLGGGRNKFCHILLGRKKPDPGEVHVDPKPCIVASAFR